MSNNIEPNSRVAQSFLNALKRGFYGMDTEVIKQHQYNLLDKKTCVALKCGKNPIVTTVEVTETVMSDTVLDENTKAEIVQGLCGGVVDDSGAVTLLYFPMLSIDK